MIYKDSLSDSDCDSMPAERPDQGCENCGETYWEHSGWRCPNSSSPNQTFSNLPAEHRYETASMKASLPDFYVSAPSPRDFQHVAVKPEEPKPVDLSDWRAWAHNKPGDCPCGIAKANCEFHR